MAEGSLIIFIVLALAALFFIRFLLFRHQVEDQGRQIEAWKVYRPEGRPLSYTLSKPWRIFWYVRKYCRKNFEASEAVLANFNAQRELRALMIADASPLMIQSEPVKIAFVGDLMWVRTNWDRYLDPDVKAYLEQFDLAFGNLETPIDQNIPPGGWHKIDCARFNSDIRLLSAFHNETTKRNIFTALSLANNHIFDQGDTGAIETVRTLDELGIYHSGLHTSVQESKPVVIERHGIRFGFYSTCYGYNDPTKKTGLHLNCLPGLAPCPEDVSVVDITSLTSALEDMEAAGAELKILYVHWGHEFELYPTQTQVELGRKFAALGFDIIAGSHPHVVQPSEVCFINGYEEECSAEIVRCIKSNKALQGSCFAGRGGKRKALINYSLGNFITAMFFWEPKYGLIQPLSVFRCPKTGGVDWHAPNATFVYNALAMHNHGKKELLLLRTYFSKNRENIEKRFPKNRAACSFLIRHLYDQFTLDELKRGPQEGDYRRALELLRLDSEESLLFSRKKSPPLSSE